MTHSLHALGDSFVSFVTLSTGTRVSSTYGAPNVFDMAFGLGRICRWTGNLNEFWPVILHSFVVADLCSPGLKWHALVHDGSDVVTNDVPKPMKTQEMSCIEHGILDRICDRENVRRLTEEEHGKIKAADNASRNAEAWVFGNGGHRASYPQRNYLVEQLVQHYFAAYPIGECVSRTGKAAAEFIDRFYIYRKLLQSDPLHQ